MTFNQWWLAQPEGFRAAHINDKWMLARVAFDAGKSEAIKSIKGLLESVADDGDCRADHHGHCQEHRLQPVEECDVAGDFVKEAEAAWKSAQSDKGTLVSRIEELEVELKRLRKSI